MTRRRKKISRSRKEPDCHDPEEKKISRSRKEPDCHDPEEKKDF